MVWLRVRRWVVRPIVWTFALVAIAVLALVSYFESSAVRVRAARLVERELTRVVGRPVRLGGLDFELLPASVVLRDLLIPGDRPEEPPFLEAREIRVEIDLDALRRDLVDLQSVSVKGIRVRVVLRPDGTDNLPRFPPSEGGGRFAVRIGGLYVEQGELELADRRVPLELSARAVLVRLAGIGGTDLQGNFTAQEIETRLPGAEPWPSTVSGKIRVRKDRIEILSARVASAYLDARAAGSIGWKGGTHGELRGRVLSSGKWLDELGWLRGEIDGDFRFDGGVRFARRELRIEGDLAAPSPALFGFQLADFAGRVEGNAERIELEIERGSYRGGPLAGRFAVDLAGKGASGTLELAAENLPVRELLADLDLPDFRVAASAHGELFFQFPFSNARRGVGSASLELRANPESAAPGALPADGVVGIELGGGRIAVRELALRAGGQRIDGTGDFALEGGGRIDIAVASEDLGELARLQPFVPIAPWPLWMPRTGHGLVEAHVRLAKGGAEADLVLDLVDLSAPGIAADLARGGLTVSASSVRDIDLALTRGASRLEIAGALPLETAPSGAVAGDSGADLRIAFESWPVEEARPWAPLALPVAGPANGVLRLGGTLADLTGDLVAEVSPVTLAGFAGEKLEVALAWNADALTVTRARLEAPAGAVAGEGLLRFAGEELDFRIASDGPGLDLALPPLSDLWAERATGTLRFAGTISGTVKQPAATLQGGIDGFALAGNDLTGEGATRLDLRLLAGRLDLDVELPGLLTVRGGGAFAPGESADLALDIGTERLDRWFELALGMPATDFSGGLHAALSVRQERGGALSAELAADRIDLKHRDRQLALIETARARFDGSRIEIASLYLGDPSGNDEIFVGGAIELEPSPALDLNVQAAASVDWIEEWSGLDFEGRFELLSTVGGSFARPELNGEAALTGARFIPPRLPHTVDRLDALALLYPDAIVLDSARGEFAGGTIAAFGRLDLPGEGKAPAYRFQTSLQNASMRYPEGFLLRGGGELTLQSMADGRQIRGEIDLDRIDYVQDIDLAPTQIIQRFLTRTRLQVDETDDVLSSTYLSVAVQGRNALRVRNNLARIDGSVDLTVRGTLANPVLFGEVTTVAGGTIEYGGNEYVLERGVLTFVNPSRIVPIVDFVARTEIDDYEVQLNVGGSLDRLATSFSANPPLSEYDVLALLATGSTASEDAFSGTGGAGTASAALAAESLLYGQAAALIGARVGTLFGIDRLKIDPLTTGDTVSAARVTVGKRLSRKIYVTYSVDPSSTAQQILEVEWKISDDLTLVLTQNGDGSYALDTRWGRRF